jgi:hypothetical protein
VPPASSHRNAGKEIENSDEEFMAAAEREFKRCTRPPKDHFEKILEATYPHHPYPVKHKHRNCTMMRRFMSSAGTSLGSDELVGDPRGRGMVLRRYLQRLTMTWSRRRYVASWDLGSYSLR